jgi:glucosamine-6-phosphate deaminase
MAVDPEVFADAADLGARAADVIADGIVAARSAGRPYLLGCPGGRSGLSTYRALAATVARRRIDLGHLVVVMMDDYVVTGPDGRPVHEDVRALHSCIRFGVEQIVEPLNAAAGPGRGVPGDHLWVPAVASPAAYDGAIADAGGIDVFLLASGAGDGHVAFNTPGAAADSRTRLVDLPDSTRRDNLTTFPSFGGDLAAVPRRGVTVGIATIVTHSAAVIMLAHGADKGTAARRLTSADAYDPRWPATVVAACAHPRLFLDRAALDAAALTAAP